MPGSVAEYLSDYKRSVAHELFEKIKAEKGATVKYILKFNEDDMIKIIDEIYELACIIENYTPSTTGGAYA